MGILFYYASALDPTMRILFRSITAHQANVKKQTMQNVEQLLDYVASHPYAVITN